MSQSEGYTDKLISRNQQTHMPDLTTRLVDKILRAIGEKNARLRNEITWEPRDPSVRERIVDWLNAKLQLRNYYRFNSGNVLSRWERISKQTSRLQSLHDVLADETSQEVLANVIALRIFGAHKVTLPLDCDSTWRAIDGYKQHTDFENVVNTAFMGYKLPLVDLAFKKIPIRLHTMPAGAFVMFELEQYACKRPNIDFGVKSGDVVLDCGGCWGDTALYFANRAGQEGRIFSYEFIPSNLAVFQKNLDLNPELAKRITVVQKPVWSCSDQPLVFDLNGPGSKGRPDQQNRPKTTFKSVTIDDFYASGRLPAVDFIKMDIEGAELPSLKGAESVIRRHIPDLAVAIYHSMDDFVSIPEWIMQLNLGYKLYLDHFSINEWETILYAASPRRNP